MPRDVYSPAPFQPFNGTLRCGEGTTTLLEPSDSGCIVDIHNHGPDPIWVRMIRDDGNRTLATRIDPGPEPSGGWCPRDCLLVATTIERQEFEGGSRPQRRPGFARVSVRRFRVGPRRFDQDRSLD